MNALYRPGPIAYIPSFIKRKMAKKKLHTIRCKRITKETYGITEVLPRASNALSSKKLAGFLER
jgi:DNA polymerase-3 subunit alpha